MRTLQLPRRPLLHLASLLTTTLTLTLALALALVVAPTTPASAGTPTLTVKAPLKVAFESQAAITATVRHGAGGQPITLQRKTTSGWVKVTARRLPWTGTPKRLTFKVTVNWTGYRAFRVVLARKGTTRGVVGSAFRITATAKTWLLSRPPGGKNGTSASVNPSVSANGRYVAFESAGDLGLGTNGFDQVYVWDRVTKQLTLVSHTTTGEMEAHPSSYPVISADGSYIAFTSSGKLAADDNGLGNPDIYRWSRAANTNVLVSKSGAGVGDAASEHPSISADGKHIAFESSASNLDGGAAGVSDIFLWDSGAVSPTLVSHGVDGVVANNASTWPVISGDGNHVAFETGATNLFDPAIYTGGDPNGGQVDVLIWDRAMGDTQAPYIVSTNTTGLGTANAESHHPSISANGRYVAFDSYAANVTPSDSTGDLDVFVWDREHLTPITLVTAPAGSYHRPAISADGNKVAFVGTWLNLIGQGDTSIDDVILWQRGSSVYTLLSQSPAKAPGNADSGGVRAPSLSPNGQWVAFESQATNLVSGVTDSGSIFDVFLRGPLY